jgi:hypothetical protein
MAEAVAGSGWVGHRVDALDASGVAKVTRMIGKEEGMEWLVVKPGRLGRATAVPAGDAVEGVECVWVPYPAHLIKSAPKVDALDALDADGERRLREHYGLG